MSEGTQTHKRVCALGGLQGGQLLYGKTLHSMQDEQIDEYCTSTVSLCATAYQETCTSLAPACEVWP